MVKPRKANMTAAQRAEATFMTDAAASPALVGSSAGRRKPLAFPGTTTNVEAAG